MSSVFRATYIHIGAALQSCDWLRGAAGAGTWRQRGGAASKSPPPSLRYFPVPPQDLKCSGLAVVYCKVSLLLFATFFLLKTNERKHEKG
jgi:hypothetical protein